MCTSSRDDSKLENTVKQSRFKHLGELHKDVNWSCQCIKSHHAQTSSGKGLQSHFWNRNIVRSSLTCAKEKKNRTVVQWSKVLFSDESTFLWRGTESNVAWSPVWSFTVSDDLGCHVICWCWSTVFYEVHRQCSHLPRNRALHGSFWWQALWRCWFHFPAGFGICLHNQMYQKLVQLPWSYCAWLVLK